MNRFWQCPKCGGILEKNEVTLQVAGKLAGLAGSATCSFCSASQSATEVYAGAFDFAESDEFIARMGADRGNVSFDQGRMRWLYRGRLVALRSDGSAKKWWQFWR
jgi:hypothetical protein